MLKVIPTLMADPDRSVQTPSWTNLRLQTAPCKVNNFYFLLYFDHNSRPWNHKFGNCQIEMLKMAIRYNSARSQPLEPLRPEPVYRWFFKFYHGDNILFKIRMLMTMVIMIRASVDFDMGEKNSEEEFFYKCDQNRWWIILLYYFL